MQCAYRDEHNPSNPKTKEISSNGGQVFLIFTMHDKSSTCINKLSGLFCTYVSKRLTYLIKHKLSLVYNYILTDIDSHAQ